MVINTRPGGQNIKCTAKNNGIYYNGLSNTEEVSMLSTVEDNRKHYTQLQYERENIEREL